MDWILFIIALFVIIGYFQIRCPKCYRIFIRHHLDTEEIDRWQGTKKVESSIKIKDAFNNMKETG